MLLFTSKSTASQCFEVSNIHSEFLSPNIVLRFKSRSRDTSQSDGFMVCKTTNNAWQNRLKCFVFVALALRLHIPVDFPGDNEYSTP